MRVTVSLLVLLASWHALATAPAPGNAWEAYGERAEVHMNAFVDRLRNSHHPDDLAVALIFRAVPAESLNAGTFDEAGRRWALANPSPRTVSLVAGWTCPYDEVTPQREFCDHHQLLSRWQQIEPNNAAAWLLTAERANANGDWAALEHSQAKLLASTHISGGFISALKLFRERMAADSEYARQPRGDRAVIALGFAMALVPSFGDVLQLCPHGRNEPIRVDRMELCRHLSALMTESREEMTAMIGNVIATAYALDDSERARLAEDKAFRMALREQQAADPRLRVDPTADGVPDYFDDYLQLMIEHGEREAMIRWLASAEPAEDGAEAAQ